MTEEAEKGKREPKKKLPFDSLSRTNDGLRRSSAP